LGDVKSVGGGEKSTQVADIARAVKLAARIEE
jgi:putative component of toxin-antitoxin plasmid stabilization module